MDEKIIKLKFSIQVPQEDGSTIDVSQLRIGRLKAKHLKALPKGFVAREGEIEPAELIPLIASIADIPESSAEEMDLEDLLVFAEELEDFLESALQTGKK